MTQTQSTSLTKHMAKAAMALITAILCALAIAPSRAHADTSVTISVTAPTSICSISTYDGSLALPTEDAFKFENKGKVSVAVTGWDTFDLDPFQGEASKADAITSANPGSWWIKVRSNQGVWRTLSQSTSSNIDPHFDASWKMKRSGSIDASNQNKATDILKLDTEGWVAANVKDSVTAPSGTSASLLNVGRVQLDSYGNTTNTLARTSGLPMSNAATQVYAPLAEITWHLSPVPCQVKYDLNDASATWGDGTTGERYLDSYEGATLEKPSQLYGDGDPISAGKMIAGWSLYPNGINPDTGLFDYWRFGDISGEELETDITLYAQWLTDGEAWAAYSSSANTLYFIRSAINPTGSTVDGNLITQAWGGTTTGQRFETETYASAGAVPWYSALYNSNASVVIKEPIAPVSTAFWFQEIRMPSFSLSSPDILSGWHVTDMKYMFFRNNITSLDVSGFAVDSVTDMEGMFRNCGASNINISGWNTSNVTNFNGFLMYTGLNANATKSVLSNLDLSSCTTMSRMFEHMLSLGSIDFGWVKRLDTSNVTDMSRMFTDCTGLIKIEFSGLDASNVVNMEAMFKKCTNLPSVNLLGLDTRNVSNMKELFAQATSLTALDLATWNTANVTDMSQMFEGCTNLESINFETGLFNTGSVTSMSAMFKNCGKLSTLDMNGLNVSACTNMSQMFYDCTSFAKFDFSSWNTANVTTFDQMFGSYASGAPIMNNLSCIQTGSGWSTAASSGNFRAFLPRGINNNSWVVNNSAIVSTNVAYNHNSRLIDANKVYYSMATGTALKRHAFKRSMSVTVNGISYTKSFMDFEPRTTTAMSSWSKADNGVEIDSSISTKTRASHSRAYTPYIGGVQVVQFHFYFSPQYFNYWCEGMSSLQRVEGIGRVVALQETETMEGAFENCSQLGTYPGSTYKAFFPSTASWDMSYVKNVSYLFNNCINLTTGLGSGLELITWRLPNNTTLQRTFGNCTSITDLSDIRNFNTAKVTTMNETFYGCTALRTVEVPWNTALVADFRNMFKNCSSLSSLDLTTFNTNAAATAARMGGMFDGCTSLIKLELGSSWKQTGGSSGYATFPYYTGSNLTATWYNATTGVYRTSGQKIPDGAGVWVNLSAPLYGVLDSAGELYLVNAANSTSAEAMITALGRTVATGNSVLMSAMNYADASSTDWEAQGWSSSVKKVVIPSALARAPQSVAHLFAGLPNLQSVVGLEHLPMSACTDFTGLFEGCSSLSSIDNVENLVVPSVPGNVSLSHMFDGCTSLESVDMSNWITSSATDFSYMFKDCGQLSSLTYPSGNLVDAAATNLLNMFAGCGLLDASSTGINVAKLNVTSNVVNLSGVFRGCSSVEKLDLTSWDTSGADSLRAMFNGCLGLAELKLGAACTWSAVAASDNSYLPTFPESLFYDGSSSYYAGDEVIPSGVGTYVRLQPSWIYTDSDKTLTLKYATAAERAAAATLPDGSGLVNVTLGYTEVSLVPWYGFMGSISSVKFAGLLTLHPESMAYWFDGAVNVASFDFTRLDASAVNNWTRTFAGVATGVSGGIALDLSGWSIGNANTMAGMFDGANISSLQIGAGWHYNDAVYADKSLQPTFPDASTFGSYDSYHLNGSDSYFEATSANCAHIPTVTGLPTLQLTYTRDLKPAGGTLFTMSLPSGGGSLMAGSIAGASLVGEAADPGGGLLALSALSNLSDSEAVALSAAASGSEGDDVAAVDDDVADGGDADGDDAEADVEAEADGDGNGEDAVLAAASVDADAVELSWLYVDEAGKGKLTITYTDDATRATADDAGLVNASGYASAAEIPWVGYIQQVGAVVFDDAQQIEVASMAHWFEGASYVTSFDFRGLALQDVADWADAFKGCSAATPEKVPCIICKNDVDSAFITAMFQDTLAVPDAVNGQAGEAAATEEAAAASEAQADDAQDAEAADAGLSNASQGEDLPSEAAVIDEPPPVPDNEPAAPEADASVSSNDIAPTATDERPPEA